MRPRIKPLPFITTRRLDCQHVSSSQVKALLEYRLVRILRTQRDVIKKCSMLIGLPSNRHVTGSNARNVLRQLRGVRCDKDSVAFCSHFVCLTRTCLMFRQLSVLRRKKNVAFVRIKQFSDDCLTKLSDWLKDLALVFQPVRGKTKTNRTL